MSKIRYCELCGEVSDTTGKMCQKCYNYMKAHPEGVYPLPNAGEVKYAINGDPICHICGMAYRKLGSHIYNKHHLTQKEYRERFKLYHSTRLTNQDYKTMMHMYNTKYYDLVVKKNLIEGGVSTRVSKTNILPGRKLGKEIVETYYNGGDQIC